MKKWKREKLLNEEIYFEIQNKLSTLLYFGNKDKLLKGTNFEIKCLPLLSL